MLPLLSSPAEPAPAEARPGYRPEGAVDKVRLMLLHSSLTNNNPSHGLPYQTSSAKSEAKSSGKARPKRVRPTNCCTVWVSNPRPTVPRPTSGLGRRLHPVPAPAASGTAPPSTKPTHVPGRIPPGSSRRHQTP
jgi:hypothetical protein